MLQKIFYFVFLFLISLKFNAQSLNFDQLEKQVISNNQKGKTNESLTLIVSYIDDNQDDYYKRYKVLILKSYTYKSLFNYNQTLKTLDDAYTIGIKSDKVDEVKANIIVEKAYVYFDIQKYDEANKLMQILKKNNYKYIDSGDIAGMIMQEAYIDFKNKRFLEAEKKYDEAIVLMNNANPKNLPIIYGKKMELYAETKEHDKALRDFKLGMQAATKYTILKYKIYLHEMLREQQMKDNDWKAAFRTYQKIDSMNTVYNANDNSNKLQLLEKDIEIQKKDFELKTNNYVRNFLLLFTFILIVLSYTIFRLLKSEKSEKKMLAKENVRIFDELKILTSNLNNHGITKINFSDFNLSERQLEIINLLQQGKSNKEIANTIFISENTVKYHLKSIYEVMSIENRSEFFKLINNSKELNQY